MFPNIDRVSASPLKFLENVGRIFAAFDWRTQDSGNESCGDGMAVRRLHDDWRARRDG